MVHAEYKLYTPLVSVLCHTIIWGLVGITEISAHHIRFSVVPVISTHIAILLVDTHVDHSTNCVYAIR